MTILTRDDEDHHWISLVWKQPLEEGWDLHLLRSPALGTPHRKQDHRLRRSYLSQKKLIDKEVLSALGRVSVLASLTSSIFQQRTLQEPPQESFSRLLDKDGKCTSLAVK